MLRVGLDTDCQCPNASERSGGSTPTQGIPIPGNRCALAWGRSPEHRAGRAIWRTSFRAAAAVAILLLSACGSNPAVISGDTSCERFRHISATPAQIKVFADNWEVMEPYADQIVSHNVTYDGHCLGVAP
jgi:hypothetical protein